MIEILVNKLNVINLFIFFFVKKRENEGQHALSKKTRVTCAGFVVLAHKPGPLLCFFSKTNTFFLDFQGGGSMIFNYLSIFPLFFLIILYVFI